MQLSLERWEGHVLGEFSGDASWRSSSHRQGHCTKRKWCTYSKKAALRFWNSCREGYADHQSRQDPHDEGTEELHLVMESGRETRPHRAKVGGELTGSAGASWTSESDHSLPFLFPSLQPYGLYLRLNSLTPFTLGCVPMNIIANEIHFMSIGYMWSKEHGRKLK